MAPPPVRAFWCRIPSRANFGDALTPWLIRRITGRRPTFVRPEEPRAKYFVVGSILGYAAAHCTVWGSGISARADLVSDAAQLLAVRGPLSRAAAMEAGVACPEVYGDPALLLPRLYQPPSVPRRGIGVIPHYSDVPRLVRPWVGSGEVRVIDPQSPVESVVDQICRCEVVVSSSLHGIIVSHAYGIPAVWVSVGASSLVRDTKFHDYYLSVGEDPPLPEAVDLDGADVVSAASRASLPTLPDLAPLWAACPFGGSC